MFSLTAHSQNIVIKGSVTDINKEPLLGVNIKVKGTSIGSITDSDGNFSLNGPKGATLIISYIGMVTQEVEYKGEPLQITLKDDSQALEEVIVVGYGTMRKKDLTGSIVQVRPDKIANENPKTVQDILRGTPGLAVGYNADAKGGGSLSIRGQRSVYTDGGHNDPLLILDGMMFYGELSEINPDDIGQIDVLKDASAAAIYGAKAANGVIIITTKKGKRGKPVINFSANIGLTQRSAYRERFSPSAYLQHYADWKEKNTYGANANGEWDAYQTGTYKGMTDYFKNPDKLVGVDLETWRNYTSNEPDESDLSIWAKRLGFTGNVLENILAGKTVDWEDKAFRLGLNQDYNASISGASEKVDYYFSMGYLRNEGALIDDTYRAIRANMKLNAKVTNWFEIGANVNFQDRSDGSIDMDEDYFLRNSPYADYADENGSPVQYPLDETYSQRGYNYDFQKQYLELEKGYTVLNTILNTKVKLPFGITYQFNVAPRFQFFYDRYFMSSELPGSNPNDRGANREQAKRFDWSLSNIITWDKTFADKHHFILTLAQEAEERQYWSDRIEARNILPSDALGFHNTQNGSKENSSYTTSDSHETADGMLARLFYSYDDRYMLTTSIRRDGYSAFGSSNPYAYFPSAAVAWTFSNEKFFRKFRNVMSTGKLRVSYGSNGNRSLSNPYVALANLYEGGGAYMGYITSSGDLQLMRYLMADRMANPTLQWEKTHAWNFALDFGFLNDRITGTLDVYKMSTKDMIMSQPLQNFTGFANITTNLGQVDNNGFELSLNTVNIRQKNFEWNTTFNFSYNKNRIKHLFYEYENVLDASGNVIGQKESDYTANGWFIGKPINEIWDYKVIGIWQKDEWEEAAKYGQVPGDPKVWNNPANDVYNEDGSLKTAVYNDDDKQFLGTTTPPVNWSLRNDFTLWKDLTLSINIYSRMGHKGLSTNYLNNDDDGGRMSYAAACKEAKEYWTIDNPTNKYARIEAQGPDGAKSPGMLYNRSFIRLENISVGYTLPRQLTQKWGIERVKVSGTVRNVATWAKDWEYGDPETGGLGTRLYSLGINLTF
ncbi:SusC/RagA family TonB-linked outer membrane protein [Bacteroides ovatus]|uniref:SusC/RagA family TonB-linked outer membrane protein n=1 Tax=Bacteroides ovatus TaxID=28116 RepID=UPI0021656705|nr:SusC/RagA family TonB-linked outer membrane protein [Bacteroides ovatus]MCS2930654.1 SusC/RagA family TonB-linked outer membrane protein [Bacteroides ovatus]